MQTGLSEQTFAQQHATPIERIHDRRKRPLQDLRISVIDQCNFRCSYCMPEKNYAEHYTFLKQEEWLSFAEIERLARLFVRLGACKIRLTGGEPLLRPRLHELVRSLKDIPGMLDVALTTNGSLLSRHAQALKASGLDRITISLDTIEPQLFRALSGERGSLDKVLDGLRLCEELGFECIKINVVLQKALEDRHILDLVRHFKSRKAILRFIEYMDVGNCNEWNPQAVVPAARIVKLINGYSPIRPIKSNYYGEVASRYAFEDGSGEVGFIASITQPFCRTCTRARLSADGKLYTCLFASQGTDLRSLLRQNKSDLELVHVLRRVWGRRDDRYSELRSTSDSSQHPPRIEMFQIGG